MEKTRPETVQGTHDARRKAETVQGRALGMKHRQFRWVPMALGPRQMRFWRVPWTRDLRTQTGTKETREVTGTA